MSRNALAPPVAAATGPARFAALGSVLARRAANWRRRRRIGSLVDLEDRILADIGLTRADVVWARRLPLDENPVRALRRIADERRSKELLRLRERAALLAL